MRRGATALRLAPRYVRNDFFRPRQRSAFYSAVGNGVPSPDSFAQRGPNPSDALEAKAPLRSSRGSTCIPRVYSCNGKRHRPWPMCAKSAFMATGGVIDRACNPSPQLVSATFYSDVDKTSSGHWFEKRSCRYSDLGFDLGEADELKATDVAVRRQPGLLASYLSWIQLALRFVSPAYPLSRD